MENSKLQKLKKEGWEIGNTSDFLDLSVDEAAYIELKVTLSQFLHQKRIKKHWTQEQLAQKIKSSQSRVAKMEKGDPTVSIDLLLRSLFALGTSKNELAKAIV